MNEIAIFPTFGEVPLPIVELQLYSRVITQVLPCNECNAMDAINLVILMGLL